ncbi:protein of unknown function [Serratia sp. Tan611]|nr:protein of unknown function [Serratia sp. Tan611]
MQDRFGDTHEMAVECTVFNPNLSKKDNESE